MALGGTVDSQQHVVIASPDIAANRAVVPVAATRKLPKTRGAGRTGPGREVGSSDPAERVPTIRFKGAKAAARCR